MTILSRAVKNAAAMMRAGEWGTSSTIPPPSASGLMGGAPGEAAVLGISTVLACVKALFDDVSSVPFMAYTGDRFGAREPLAQQPRIVVEPFGPDLLPEEGFGQLIVSRAMRGNGYAFVVSRDRRTNLPDQLAILHPDSVRPTRKKGMKIFRVGAEEFGPDEIVHVTGMMLPAAVAGVDVLTAQRTNFELAMKVGEYAEGFFGSGGSPVGVISVPGSGDRAKARLIKQTWESDHGGVPNAHRPAVLFGGATWEQLSVAPENAQFLETRRFMREEVCGLYGVPLGRIQGTAGEKGSGEYDDGQYAKHGLLPAVSSVERVWNPMIPGEQNSWTLFDLDVFLRANALERAKVAQIDRVIGRRTIDELRAPEGWAPLPNGQGSNPFTPLNSNTASPHGGEDNAPKPGGEPGPDEGGPS